MRQKGKLAIAAKDDTNNLLLMMPDRSNDAGLRWQEASRMASFLTALPVFDEALTWRKEASWKPSRLGSSVLGIEDVIQHYVNLDTTTVSST